MEFDLEEPGDFWNSLKSLVREGRENQGTVIESAKNLLFRQLEERLFGSFLVQISNSGLSLKPTSLLSAMYLQFSSAIVGFEGITSIRKCEACGTWFEVSPRAGRPEKKYCSDACKMRAYRNRKSKVAGASPRSLQ